MHFHLSRGQRARNADSAFFDRPASLQDAKLAAWALSVGEIRNSDGERYGISRPHRGQLPDVDFSIVVPDPRRTSPLRQLARMVVRLFGRPSGRKAGARGSGQSPPLGDHPPASYIGVTEAGDPRDFLRVEKTPLDELSRAA